MIRFEPNLDIFEVGTEAIVNPVNCVGVMGAGLALAFKERYPEAFAAYRIEHRLGKLRMGKVFPFRRKNDQIPKWILHLPTKFHYDDKSDIAQLSVAMADLVETINNRGIKSIAIPKLGCGLGGLKWEDVRLIMVHHLRQIEDRVDVVILGEPAPTKPWLAAQ